MPNPTGKSRPRFSSKEMPRGLIETEPHVKSSSSSSSIQKSSALENRPKAPALKVRQDHLLISGIGGCLSPKLCFPKSILEFRLGYELLTHDSNSTPFLKTFSGVKQNKQSKRKEVWCFWILGKLAYNNWWECWLLTQSDQCEMLKLVFHFLPFLSRWTSSQGLTAVLFF